MILADNLNAFAFSGNKANGVYRSVGMLIFKTCGDVVAGISSVENQVWRFHRVNTPPTFREMTMLPDQSRADCSSGTVSERKIARDDVLHAFIELRREVTSAHE